MVPSATSSDLDSSVRQRIPRKKATKRAELVVQPMPGLDDRALNATRGRFLLRERDLLGSHGLQALQRRSPFSKLSVHDLARELEKAVVSEERPGGVLSDEEKSAPDLAPVDDKQAWQPAKASQSVETILATNAPAVVVRTGFDPAYHALQRMQPFQPLPQPSAVVIFEPASIHGRSAYLPNSSYGAARIGPMTGLGTRQTASDQLPRRGRPPGNDPRAARGLLARRPTGPPISLAHHNPAGRSHLLQIGMAPASG